MLRRPSLRARKPGLTVSTRANYSRSSSGSISSPPQSPVRKITPAKKSPTLRGSDQTLVTITVIGEKDATPKKFVLHKVFVCHHSYVFDRCFNGGFIEATTQTMTFNTISTAAFGIFADWIYTQNVEDGDGELPSFTDLIDLWILADSLFVAKLKNCAMRAIHAEVTKQEKFSPLFFTYVYENTVPQSPLRKVFVDLFVASAEPIDPDVDFPIQMLVDIVNAVAEIITRKGKIPKEKIGKYLVSED